MNLLKIVLLSLVLSSCASLNSQPKLQSKVISEGSLTAVETSPDNDVVYLHTKNNKEIICASRGQDFAVVQSGGDSLGVKEGSTSLNAGANTSSGVAELGGINPGVLLAREVMFRTCEFLGNLKSIDGLTSDNAKELFQTSLDAVLKISSDYSSSPGTGQANESVSSNSPNEN